MTTKTTPPAIDPATGDEIITVREFAVREGYKPNYGHELAKAGRLVMAPDGKNCLARASHERSRASKDPSKQGVADRHAAARAAATNQSDPPTKTASAHDEEVGKTYHASKAIKEKYLALSARRDYEESIKLLTCTHDVYFHVENAMTICRVTLERLPPSLAPQLAAINDEMQILQILNNNIEHILDIMASEFKKIGE